MGLCMLTKEKLARNKPKLLQNIMLQYSGFFFSLLTFIILPVIFSGKHLSYIYGKIKYGEVKGIVQGPTQKDSRSPKSTLILLCASHWASCLSLFVLFAKG